MPKIIEHGSQYHEIECYHCHAKIGYFNKEVSITSVDDIYTDYSYRKYYIICPECEKEIVFAIKSTITSEQIDNKDKIKIYSTPHMKTELYEP